MARTASALSWAPEGGDQGDAIETGPGWAYLSFDSGQEVGFPTDERRGDGWKAAKKFELNIGDLLESLAESAKDTIDD